MKATQMLHDLGQSLWLDNITRDLLDSGTLKRYIDELSVTGLTSNPTIFDHAIKNSAAYDAAIQSVGPSHTVQTNMLYIRLTRPSRASRRCDAVHAGGFRSARPVGGCVSAAGPVWASRHPPGRA